MVFEQNFLEIFDEIFEIGKFESRLLKRVITRKSDFYTLGHFENSEISISRSFEIVRIFRAEIFERNLK